MRAHPLSLSLPPTWSAVWQEGREEQYESGLPLLSTSSTVGMGSERRRKKRSDVMRRGRKREIEREAGSEEDEEEEEQGLE
jgi:hypothetical protein